MLVDQLQSHSLTWPTWNILSISIERAKKSPSTIWYDTRCCFNVRSKADIISLIYRTEPTTKMRKKDVESKKRICSEISAKSGKSMESVLKRHGASNFLSRNVLKRSVMQYLSQNLTNILVPRPKYSPRCRSRSQIWCRFGLEVFVSFVISVSTLAVSHVSQKHSTLPHHDVIIKLQSGLKK